MSSLYVFSMLQQILTFPKKSLSVIGSDETKIFSTGTFCQKTGPGLQPLAFETCSKVALCSLDILKSLLLHNAAVPFGLRLPEFDQFIETSGVILQRDNSSFSTNRSITADILTFDPPILFSSFWKAPVPYLLLSVEKWPTLPINRTVLQTNTCFQPANLWLVMSRV